MRAAALIVAAGRGERAGGGVPKQYRMLGCKPVLRWSVEAMRASPEIDRIVIVIGPGDEQSFRAATDGLDELEWTTGGDTRTASVSRGLEALARGEPPAAVLIHDAARPGLTPAMVARLCAALESVAATAPALMIADALKRAGDDGAVLEDVPRTGLWRVQTPQAFRFTPLHAAYRALPSTATFDDDLAIARGAGMTARLIEGSPALMKVTAPEDFVQVERMLTAGSFVPCVGTGFDAHRFGPGDHVTLCGVRIAHHRSLVGHSDADAAWHALTDAILGALGEGDIGDHFPPTDPQWRGADSEVFLRHAVDLVTRGGGRIAHVDVTLICEHPRVKPHREAMRVRTAQVIGLPLNRVSVKATTTERLGFLGREEGLAAQAAATVLLPG
ncbi:MAG: bifunctional 2-C-methyl-D-erythritol 4-phosphate cytidylyltransferase/2-C-methyl-D-erythritol 2,4-cyclodiphosphate synthase [Hyphomonadaceae bacterium]|nr:MAG: ispDF [Caulobacteraceae bacterium]MBT9445108.1 bifunctional 2-C-methyl-D-erythritol 4-phosphate cytidylyltransferase/2-C-methyl-D-erythritol 2,4-cyclodiphosphate synthase [Hyphomonadaceae bacterium]TPW08431.1 MAG: ispDF [Alphaproteobacteria bacterium]